MTKQTSILGGVFLVAFVTAIIATRPVTETEVLASSKQPVNETVLRNRTMSQRPDSEITFNEVAPELARDKPANGFAQVKSPRSEPAPEQQRSGGYNNPDLEAGQYRITLSKPDTGQPDAEYSYIIGGEPVVEFTETLEPGQSRRIVNFVKPTNSVSDNANVGITGADPYFLEPGQSRTIVGPRPPEISTDAN